MQQQQPYGYNSPPQPNSAYGGTPQGQYISPQQPQYGQPPQQPQPQPYGANADFLSSQASQFMINPAALQMAANLGGEWVKKQPMSGWFNWPAWRPYWNVNHSFVLSKLRLLLFPFRHKSWARMIVRSEQNGQMEGWKSPRQDVNAPDLYVPVMAFVTYILLVGAVMGSQNKFKPDVLTMTASTAFFFTVIEVLFLRLGLYLLSVNLAENNVYTTDLVAYSGYKFVSIIMIQLISLTENGWAEFVTFAYVSLALGWYTVFQ